MRVRPLFAIVTLLLGCAARDEIIATVDDPGGMGGSAGGGGDAPLLFAPPSHHEVACGEATDIAVGSVDADGTLDVITAGGCLNLYAGDGLGGVQAHASVSTGVGVALALGHVDAGATLDVVAFDVDAHVFLGDGMGTFAQLAGYPAGGPGHPGQIALAQLYGDGSREMLTASGSVLSIWTGAPSGQFTGPHPIAAPASISHVISGDFDGDALADILLVSDGLRLLVNDGSGGFLPAVQVHASADMRSVVAGDLDADGCLDAIAFDGAVGMPAEGVLLVLLNDCHGAFTSLAPIALAASDVALGDLDGDGNIDLAAAAGTAVAVARGRGDGRFAPWQQHAVGAQTRAVALGDLDGDGRDDIIASVGDGVVILLNGS
jgi:hypothetical protein